MPDTLTANVDLIGFATALGIGLLIGSRMRGAAGTALRLASKPLLLGAAKALWSRFGK